MVGLSHTINEEEWRNGIRACALCPGEVNTPILEQRKLRRPDEELPRLLQPGDVAAAVAFLAALPPRVTVNEMVMIPTHRRKPQAGEF
jgi:NAD(P)-dependent dehydrogenase (short-subunit alcohol dehydrogenase family)